MKHLFTPLLALGLLAGCVEADPSAPQYVRTPQGVSVGAAPGMTALETMANMTPEAAAPINRNLIRPDTVRNAAGEIEIVMGAADKDSTETVRKAASVTCQSLKMTLVGIEELPRKKGVRQNLYRCK